jgi:glyoxylase-like metal-dependent hydrolase (beta-lactamase superfamily II)
VARGIEPIRCSYETTAVMAYLVDGGRLALIDSGGASHPAGPIREVLRARGADLGDVRTIVHTHGHWDHAGGDAAIREVAEAEIVIHEAGVPLLRDEASHLDGYATVAARLMERDDLVAEQRAAFGTLFGGPVAVERRVRDGEEIDLGGGVVLRVVAVPGHSDDHVALYWEDEGVLVAGDAAQGTGSRAGACPLYFADVGEARASIRRLLEIPFRTLHVSHPFGRLGTEERATTYGGEEGQAFLRESLTALDAMEEALREARKDGQDSTFPELVRAATERLRQADRWPLRIPPAMGIAANSVPTFAGLWREMERA